jgi:hypothetical protein
MQHLPVLLLPICVDENSEGLSSEVPDVRWRNELVKKGFAEARAYSQLYLIIPESVAVVRVVIEVADIL